MLCYTVWYVVGSAAADPERGLYAAGPAERLRYLSAAWACTCRLQEYVVWCTTTKYVTMKIGIYLYGTVKYNKYAVVKKRIFAGLWWLEILRCLEIARAVNPTISTPFASTWTLNSAGHPPAACKFFRCPWTEHDTMLHVMYALPAVPL